MTSSTMPGLQAQVRDVADRNAVRHSAGGEQPGEHAGDRDDEEDLRRQVHRGHRDVPELAPADFAMDRHGDEGDVDAGRAGGLGRRENAAVEPAENDHRHHDRPGAVLERHREGAPSKRRAGVEPLLLRA